MTLQPDQPRCLDESCEKASKCARFADRNGKSMKPPTKTLASKHEGQPCFFFMEIPRIIHDRPEMKF